MKILGRGFRRCREAREPEGSDAPWATATSGIRMRTTTQLDVRRYRGIRADVVGDTIVGRILRMVYRASVNACLHYRCGREGVSALCSARGSVH
jgi:hypothetical protein